MRRQRGHALQLPGHPGDGPADDDHDSGGSSGGTSSRVAPPRMARFGLLLVLAGALPALGFVLLPAIGWPDSAQGMSAAEALPRIAADPTSFRVGFGAMVAGGVLFHDLPGAPGHLGHR